MSDEEAARIKKILPMTAQQWADATGNDLKKYTLVGLNSKNHSEINRDDFQSLAKDMPDGTDAVVNILCVGGAHAWYLTGVALVPKKLPSND